MKILIPIFIAAFAFAVSAQSELPDHGTIADIKGKTKIYIVADTQNTKQILKGLKDQDTLVLVDRPEDADFFLEYKETSQRQVQTAALFTLITGQLDVYFYRDKKKVVAWTESKVSGMAFPSLTLTKKFVKEFVGK